MSRESEKTSNLGLLAIISILIIIAHHYVVNSGLATLYDYNHITANMVFLQLFGSGGKVAINCFLLMAGYFLIDSEYDFKKSVWLYAEIKFYKIILWLFFIVIGYETFSIGALKQALFSVIYSIGYGKSFPDLYLLVFLLIPFINTLVKTLDKKQMTILLGILLMYFSGISTIFRSIDTMQYLGWYITVYMIGGYIKLYPNRYFSSKRFGFIGASLIFAFVAITILTIDLCRHVGIDSFKNYYYWVNDSNKAPSIALAICLFIGFLNMRIKKNRLISWLASSTFGVFLIHTISDSMRKFLWRSVLQNTSFYGSALLPLHAIGSVLFVYLNCFSLDRIRIRLWKCLGFTQPKN